MSEDHGWKYELGQLVFWSIVFGMVLVAIIGIDEIVIPLIKGTLCSGG